MLILIQVAVPGGGPNINNRGLSAKSHSKRNMVTVRLVAGQSLVVRDASVKIATCENPFHKGDDSHEFA